MQLRKETCIGCECELQYTKSIPTKQMGVMMHMGERFCTGGKRARKFKRSDPKIYVPDWCPKRKKGNASDTTIVVMMRTVPMMIAGEGM